MLITALDGSTFELTIADYQFPEMTPSHIKYRWDPNWLVIHAEAKASHERWNYHLQFTLPNMTTVEAEEFCTWLTGLADQQDVEPYFEFIEPELKFKVTQTTLKGITLQVKFVISAARSVVQTKNWQHFDLTFVIQRDDLKLAAQQWCEEIKHFPRRAGF